MEEHLISRCWSTLAKTSAVTAVTAVAGSIATTPSARWYQDLDLPRWQPPPVAFPVVWTALFADIAATSAEVITRLKEDDRHHESQAIHRALGLNLVLNAGWRTLFWRARRFDMATVEAAVLTVSSATFARRAAETD